MQHVRPFRICVLVGGVLGVTPACDKTERPERIQLELTNPVLSKDPVSVGVRASGAAGVLPLNRADITLTALPGELLRVASGGVFSCQRSGDAKLTVSVAGTSQTTEVHCRLVERLEAPDVGRVELAAGPFVPKVRVIGQGGGELHDVPLSFSSKTSGVIFPKDNQLVPKDVGRASVIARAGQASQEFKVDVVRSVRPEALPIDGNRRIHYSLDPGKYELRVVLPAPKPFIAEWRGAPYCNYKGEGKEHISICVLRTKGGVDFDNPAFLSHGDKTVSTAGVELREVP